METLRETPLHGRHVALGARMVPFAGWEMPVQYEGVIPEHRAVRADAGVFDVSHMGEIEIEGPAARDLLQATLSNDVDRLSPGDAQYTLVTNDAGGILDDVIVYRLDEQHYLVVANASNAGAVFDWLEARKPPGVEVRDMSDDYALLAVQGPRSLERLALPSAAPFTWARAEFDGVAVMVNRTGYTGELGVELACEPGDAGRLWDAVLARGVVPCGLGARDTLRLEMCYPLHGNDIGPDRDAISAGLGWACALDTEFTGADALRRIKADGPAEKLVPFVMIDRAIPRQGMTIDGGGVVTSGTMSPMLELGVGLGYVPAASARPGTELVIDVRGKPRHAQVSRKPLYTKERS
jgi:glycine cleavage system T protein (aminomethyltransferase)